MGCCASLCKCQVVPETTPSSESASQTTFVDNNYRGRRLPGLQGLPSNDVAENHQSSTSTSTRRIERIPASLKNISFDQPNQSANTVFINVLLLGESGVGKSTFINALVNYLRFDTLEQASSGKPIALMSVSFLMTIGDQFEERIVSFGDADPNEDHQHPGESVTQYCKSYVFTIGTRTKLRIIDTPGMGDSRGPSQDDLNMQNILSFVNNLPHINAICILLKPNESQLNVVFQSYFSQLIGFLGENVRNNIIFCFTNTRTTFFTPGDSAPLLRKTLDDFPIKDIPFKKPNTFCFDSESFRYLIAQQDGIKFDDYQKEEYKESWVTSVTESTRLLTYICGVLKAYSQTQWRSIEHARFQITEIIRPIFETTRNLLRNLILKEENSPEVSIKLCPAVIAASSAICTTCKNDPKSCSNFWILPDVLHVISQKRPCCECDRSSHIDVYYTVDYKLLDGENRQSSDDMKSILDQLKEASLEFGCFFLRTNHKSKPNDPLLFYFNYMIEKEDEICGEKGKKCLNPILCKKLNDFKEEYQQKQNMLMSKKNSIDLAHIYELIHSVSKIDLISEQIQVIKQFHQTSMKKQERVLP